MVMESPILQQYRHDLDVLCADTQHTQDPNALVIQWLPFVLTVAKRYARQAPLLSYEDLVQEGNLGLLTAAEKFDPERGYSFGTYAEWWIKNALWAALAQHHSSMHISTAQMQTAFRLIRLLKAQPSLSIEELAQEAGLTLEVVRRLFPLLQGHVSIDQQYGDDEDDGTIGDTLADAPTRSPAAITELHLRNEMLRQLLGYLTDRERQVVLRLYGLCPTGQEETPTEIGRQLHMTRETVQKVAERAILKLSYQARKLQLHLFLDE